MRGGRNRAVCVLDEDMVLILRERAATGESLQSLSREFGFSGGTISHAVRGRTWKDVGGPITPRAPGLTREEANAAFRAAYTGERRTRHLAKRRGLVWSPEVHQQLEDEKTDRDAVRAMSSEDRRLRRNELARADANGRGSLAQIHHLLVLEQGDGECGICGEDVDPTSFEVDHYIPLSRGGIHHLSNLQPAHMSCNRRKYNTLPKEIA